MVNIVANPVPLFVNTSGAALNNGSVYIGVANVDPVKNPITVFQDAGMAIPLQQPLSVQAGMPALNGTPIQVFTAQSNFSMAVFDTAGNLVMSLPNVSAVAQLPPISGIIPKRYVAGTDFTPGVTTQLQLPTNPGAVSNIWIFFDGVYQADDQVQSLTGSTLTFNSPIPVGVQEVNIKCGSQLSVGTPGAGSVGDTQLAWAGILNRVVDTIAALRGLSRGTYNRAFVIGYYTAGDGGGGEYWLDPSDTTTADNGGTVIVANDGGRWKLQHGPQVSAMAFGVIPGLTDVSASLNAALADHVGKYRLLLPQGTLNCASTIDIPAGSDVLGTGPVNSSYGPVISLSPHGTLINSTVANGWAVRIAYNTANVAGGTNVGNFEIKNAAGKGLFCQSMGTGAIIHDIGIHDCLQDGAQFSYFQDSSLINLEVVNCGGSSYYGVRFDTNCNACRVDKLLIVQCRQPLWVDSSTFFDFYNAHIEQGEYASPPNNVVNCTFIAGGFKFTNCQSINFYGGLFVPNSSTYLAAQYSIAESATPFYFTTDAACKNIKMFGPKFSSPENGSRFLTANNLEIVGGTFNAGTSTVTCIEGTNVKLKGGQVELYDNQTQTNMLFTYLAGASEITDFSVICSNPSSADKTSGALFDGVAILLGNYQVAIDKYFTQMSSAVKYRGGMGYGGLGYSLAGGTIDITKQNAGEAIVLNTVSGPLQSINGFHGTGTKYTVINNTAGSMTVGTGGNISTPSAITVPAYGSIDIKHIPGTSALSPVV